jgi:hypothetical protein
VVGIGLAASSDAVRCRCAGITKLNRRVTVVGNCCSASSKILRLPPAYDAEVLSVLRSDPESELKRNVLALFLLKRGLSAGTNPRSLQQSADISMRMGHEVAKDPNPGSKMAFAGFVLVNPCNGALTSCD